MLNWTLALLAGLLVLGVAASQWSARRAEAAHPPIGHFAEIDGVRLHYTDSGPGPAGSRPLVLIHGASTSLLDFHASIAPALSRRHRVVAVDRPGHGYSERPEGAWPDPSAQARLIHGLAERLRLARPILVGHSLAGTIALAYLLDFPDTAAGAVLLAGASHPWEGGVAWYNDLAGVPVLGALFAHAAAGSLGRLAIAGGIESVFDPERPVAGYRSRTGVDLSLRPSTFLANAEDIRLLSPFLEGQSARYGELHLPILFITGSGDDIVPSWNHRDRLLALSPRVAAVDLEAAGHALHHTRRERVVGLIEDFAAGLEDTPGGGHGEAAPGRHPGH